MESVEQKIFFQPGDIVTIKQDIPNKPIMFVVKKETRTFKDRDQTEDNYFIGIKCRWFSDNKELCEAIFNTKDLQKI